MAEEITLPVGDVFSVAGYDDYLTATRRFGKELADELLTLQLSLGRLKVAIAQAFAPIASVVVPRINEAIAAVTRFAGVVRGVLGALISGARGNDTLAASAAGAAQAEKKLAASASSAGRAVKRSIMGFDELNRLNGSTGGSSGTSAGVSFAPVKDTLSPEIQKIVGRVLAFLEPLRSIDLTALRGALARLGTAFSGLGAVAGEAMRQLWQQVLTPFAAWVGEHFGPALTNGMAATLEAVAVAAEPVIAGITALWQALQPVVAYVGQVVVGALQAWEQSFADLAMSLRASGSNITAIFRNIGQVISGLWSVVQPVLQLVGAAVQSVFATLGQTVGEVVKAVSGALAGLTGFLAGAFTGDWKRAWEGIKQFLRSIVNGVIGLLNSMISRIVSALNAVIRTANKLHFTVPSWVPGLGGKQFGFNMKTLTAPQIPYLARGAVLPANRPFLAMVGDQHHGTNVEAPLATIQEAVAVVLGEQLGGLMAGLEAMVTEQRRTRAAVENIQVGDSVIGRAAQRYNSQRYLALGRL